MRPLVGSLDEVVEAAISRGVKFVYWYYLDGGSASVTIADPLGSALQLDHAPYGGLIVVDHADILLRERPDEMCELIEAFLHVFHHWYDQKKPCHLCFQMEQDDSVRKLFVRGADKYWPMGPLSNLVEKV
jgi:hypothetical protein